jgi:amidase
LTATAPALADAFVERFVIEPAADGPLRGTSFAVKDLFDVAGHHTGCGNPTWRATHAAATANAAVVQALLQAGARLIGKTRTDEMAYSIEGRNFHEGAPLNPAAPERLTGGSSSGAASAAAGGEVDFAIGTDTAGSVRVPAAWCGLVGLRPTHARVSAAGVTPLAPSFDTVGWLARSTGLIRRVAGVLLGERAAPASSLALVRDAAVNAYADPAVAALLDSMFDTCAARGLRIGEVSLVTDLKAVAECLRVAQAHEVWSTHGRWIDSAQPRFGPGVAERFAAARGVTADQARAAAQERAAILARLDVALPPGVMLCLPTVPAPAPRRDASPEELQSLRSRLMPLTALASLSGRPQITLPLPGAEAAPVGFSLLGWRNGDEALLEVAQLLTPR